MQDEIPTVDASATDAETPTADASATGIEDRKGLKPGLARGSDRDCIFGNIY